MLVTIINFFYLRMSKQILKKFHEQNKMPFNSSMNSNMYLTSAQTVPNFLLARYMGGL